MATEFFGNTVTLARQQALPALKARAEREGIITVICMDCWCFIEDKPGAGVSGLSHGLCPPCGEERRAEVSK